MSDESLVSSEDKLAIKIKIVPNAEQAKMLDEMFKKWSSICNRISRGKEDIETLRPDEGKELQFNSTQLNSATMDVSDLKKAMARQGERLEAEVSKLRGRYETIDASLRDPSRRHTNPQKPSSFYPSDWDISGRLTPRFHTARHYSTELRKLKAKEDKMLKTINKIKNGKIVFKPKRITLWPSSVNMAFKGSRLLLKPFANGFEMELPIVISPQKTADGKSQKASAEYMRNALLGLAGYSINQLLFGMNRSQKMLANAKKPEKVEKFLEQMKNKDANFDKKIKALEGKWLLDRKLKESEKSSIAVVRTKFFKSGKVELNEDYLKLLKHMANEILERDGFVNLNKYPILSRKPMKRYKQKNIDNLKPNMWKYYIQFGYEPIFERKASGKPKNIMGIDRGLTHLLAVAVFSPDQQKFLFNHLESNPIMHWKWKLRKIRRSIQHMERRIRAEKNKHIHEAQLKKRLGSIEEKTEQHYHIVSSKIINWAIEYEAAIVLESLSHMKQRGGKKSVRTRALNYALSLFDYEKVARLITYKARIRGIPVYDVLPGMTSKTCATCLLNGSQGAYVRGLETTKAAGKATKRKNMKIGKCMVCNSSENSMIDADLNAARVIAICKYKNLNDPQPAGSRKVFKRF